MKTRFRQFFLFLFLAAGLAACNGQSPANPTAVNTPAVVQDTAPFLPTATPAELPQTGVTEPPVVAVGPGTDIGASCTMPATLTPSGTEGPYYTAGSPERTSLVEDLPGTRLVLTGYVLDQDCRAVPGAWIDFWQADSQGVYDNEGYTLRGHQYTDENGQYTLETIIPGQYPGRTEHIHVKVQAPGGPVLTTQLYFPDAAQNQSDRIFDPALLIDVISEESDLVHATYHFVINQ